ncbi:MAG: PAAR domain-containing protein [Acetobacter aceti]
MASSKPAARTTDMHTCPETASQVPHVGGPIASGSPNVFINGRSAARVGDIATCNGPLDKISEGSASVFINGKPAARMGDRTEHGGVVIIGSSNVFIGGPRQSTICTSLRNEEATFAGFMTDAQASSAAYDPPEKRQPPDGYRNATEDDLRKLRLSQAMLEHPIDRRTGKSTEFRAAVFINEKTGAPLVAYKGTSGKQDWGANLNQGIGRETFYYDQAQFIARRVQQSPVGTGAQLTGHSLGGGMASAASRASGLPATTINPAGLNARTVPHPVSSEVDMIYVRGEVLHASQRIPGMPHALATRTWALDPADHYTLKDRLLNVSSLGLHNAVRSVKLHFMGSVMDALKLRQAAIEGSLAANDCP